MPDLEKLTVSQALELLGVEEEVDIEIVNAIAAKFKDDPMIMRYCLEKKYNPDKVDGELLKDRSVLFLKYRESIKKVLSLTLTPEEKASRLDELRNACMASFDTYFSGNEELRSAFSELFDVGKESIDVEAEKIRAEHLEKYRQFLLKREIEGVTPEEEEEAKREIDFKL